MMATETERVLAKPTHLKEYLTTLPIDFELRFPSTTSLKGDFAVIMIIYNTITKCVLLGAYNKKLSGLPKSTVKVETDDFLDIGTKETAFTLLRFAMVKETGLEAEKIKWLDLLPVRNTNPDIDAEFHDRYYALIDEFSGKVKIPDEVLDPKIKEFVWVKDYMLNMIFDQPFLLNGIPAKPHAQKEAYKRFIQHKDRRSESSRKRVFGFNRKFKRKGS